MAITYIKPTPKEQLQKALSMDLAPPDPPTPTKKKHAGGRPVGAKDKTKRRTPGVKDDTSTTKLATTVLAGHLEKTRTMSTEEIIERHDELPLAGGSTKLEGGDMTPIAAERMVLIYRLSIRGMSERQIAEQLDIAQHTVARALERLNKTLRLDPKKLDVGHYMGETLAFYQEIRQMALLVSSNTKETTSTKLNAMRVAMQAETDKNLFLTRVGVYTPTVGEVIQRWVLGTAEDMMGAARKQGPRVNLAAEVGRVLAKRGPDAHFDNVSDVEFTAAT